MTREEMIDALEELKTKNIVEGSEDSERNDYALQYACGFLEMWKESDDAISRREALEIFKDIHPLDYNANAYKTKIKNLPPVYPKAKVGKWYRVNNGDYESPEYVTECSECKEQFEDGWDFPYCPMCGCRMEGVEE